jgi:hypothetical protein
MKRIWAWAAGWLQRVNPVAPPPFPIDPAGGGIDLPSEAVHELFHLVRRGGRAEAARRVRKLTGASAAQAAAYVETLLRRR